MNELTRIAEALERIASVLEEQNKVGDINIDYIDWPSFNPSMWGIPNPKDCPFTEPTVYGKRDKSPASHNPADTPIKCMTEHFAQRFGMDDVKCTDWSK